MKRLLQNECGNTVVAQLPVAQLRKQEVGEKPNPEPNL